MQDPTGECEGGGGKDDATTGEIDVIRSSHADNTVVEKSGSAGECAARTRGELNVYVK
ncbi:hypothetical protein DVH05_012435 [Phytophthora capsici]|nr:hypothetical protein DVH05_012435 [Phytophthora capsici]